MNNLTGRRDWTRHHPLPKRIAAALLQDAALLNLRTRRLESDIRSRFGVSTCTARTAVAIARKVSRATESTTRLQAAA